jgi:hypothetical protein
MLTRSPRAVPTGTIRDLDLPGRAVTALTRAGVTTVDELALLTRRDLAAIRGLGPGTIAAIRLVVPEPPSGPRRPGRPRDGGDEEIALPPEPGPAAGEPPSGPVMPSFDSLRAPRRRTAVDLLVPGPPPAHPATAPDRTTAPRPAAAPRPAEYADLLRLAERGARALAGLPGRAARWSVRESPRCLRRLLGVATPGR